jgi:thioredoxin 1
MQTTRHYTPEAHDRAEIDSLRGAAVLEFGTGWCGYCRAAEPIVEAAFSAHPDVKHIKVEDGSGRPLGRSFGIKLWPTLIFLRDGREVARLVRPNQLKPLEDALAVIDPH